MSIAITGATGQLGAIVVAKLKEKIAAGEIIALVRNVEKAAGLGVTTREFDYSRPETLQPALAGVDTLLLISGSEVGKRGEQHRNVITAAKQAGVKWIVYTSLLHADRSSLSLAAEHVETEAELKKSGIPYTLLRNGWYTENYTAGIPAALANGALVGSAGNGKISSAPRADYAEAAVNVLTTTGHAGKTYELAADEPYTLTDFAAALSKQTGKNIPYHNLPEAEYAAILTNAGFPAWLAGAFASWDTGASKNDLFDDSKQLSAILGRPTTPLATVIAAAL
jgi:NAD(P)H dehydrogenase (quinone)